MAPSEKRCASAGMFRLAIAVCARMFVLTMIAAPTAQAQTFTVLHAFTGGADGGNPQAGLTMDRGGRLYGTCSGLGLDGVYTEASAFKLTELGSSWLLNPLYDFLSFGDGYFPKSELVSGPGGALYGTTSEGGGGECGYDIGCGVVFKLQPPPTACASVLCPWTETVLYLFAGGADGAGPNQVTFDAAGNVYGSTYAGGAYDYGMVYELSLSGGVWIETILYNFTGGSDGGAPTGGLIFDAAGNLYGTAYGGGSNKGAVYELSPSGGSWTVTVLHNFQGSDGSYPYGGLVADPSGNLYGATSEGGSNEMGTIFELAQPGTWTFEMLYSFPSYSVGEGPNAPLVLDSAGNLYGTTYEGGAYGNGTAFKLTPSNGSWIETDLHDFASSDGINPNGGLIFDGNGNLYGTSQNGGGTGGDCYDGSLCGTAWELTP